MEITNRTADIGMHAETKSPSANFIPFQEVNRHGFSGPMTVQQSVPVLLAFVNLTEAIYMLTCELLTLQSALLLILLTVSFICMFVLWLLATLSDPTDAIQLQHRAAILNEQELDPQLRKFRCKICNTYTSSNSFHCLKCKRCVDYFDHHCKWINNCVGRRNYFLFIGLVFAVLIFEVLILALNGWWVSREIIVAKIAVQAITISINVLPVLALTYLTVLHVYLMLTKRSTIGLIMRLRKCQVSPEQSAIIIDTSRPNKLTGESNDADFEGGGTHALSTVGRTIELTRRCIRRTKLTPLENSVAAPQSYNPELHQAAALSKTQPNF